MKVYISGKIGEDPISEDTHRKFRDAERLMWEKGHQVFNPTNREWVVFLKQNHDSAVASFSEKGTVSKYEYFLMKDIQQLSKCDAIYVLADWKKSPGARAEHAFAEAVGKRFFYEDRFQACEHLCKEMHKLVAKGKPPGEYLEKDIIMAEIAYSKKHLDRVWRPLKEEKF